MTKEYSRLLDSLPVPRRRSQPHRDVQNKLTILGPTSVKNQESHS